MGRLTNAELTAQNKQLKSKVSELEKALDQAKGNEVMEGDYYLLIERNAGTIAGLYGSREDAEQRAMRKTDKNENDNWTVFAI